MFEMIFVVKFDKSEEDVFNQANPLNATTAFCLEGNKMR